MERAGRHLGIAVASTARVANVCAVVLGGHFAALEEWIAPACDGAWTITRRN